MSAADDAKARQQEEQLAQHYLDGAILARTVSYKALELALKQAEDGTLRDPAKTAMNAAITSGTLLDKRLVLQERPTQIISDGDPHRTVGALARKLGITIDSTADEIPDAEAVEPNTQPALQPPDLPLLSESGAAKRARAREDAPADQPAD